MVILPADGTRAVLPDAAARRADLLARLRALYDVWGYELVEVPALERYDPDHPRAGQSFKLSDRDSGVLALRADFTPALANLVRLAYPARHARSAGAGEDGEGSDEEGGPGDALRLQYRGPVWQAIDPELARTREFSQVGLELIGVSNARADAELIHLARESVRAAGLEPRVEIGNPGFVRALLDGAGVPPARRAAAADAIDRKDLSDLAERLDGAPLPAPVWRALERVPDLYGGSGAEIFGEVFAEATALADEAGLPAARREVERLRRVVAQFEDASELLLDLGMARRLSYYTGVTFRAYTPDYGQPLLGGGRYDGALLPRAAGFAIGLERILAAAPEAVPGWQRPRVLARDDAAARRLRAAGVGVRRALAEGAEGARAEARAQGIPFVLHADPADSGEGALEAVAAGADRAELERLRRLARSEAPISEPPTSEVPDA